MSINQFERASKLWDILISVANSKKTITYKEITQETEIHWRSQRYPLDYIQSYCIEKELPPLTVLAVNSSTKIPGTGFIACDDDKLESAMMEVYNFNWKSQDNPFKSLEDVNNIEELVKAIKNLDTNNEKLQKVRVRGILQELLKKAALDIYNNRCAMCELSIVELLEACHIKPYSDCTDIEKKDLRNIIILCRNHHKLFDEGIISIDKKYKMHLDPKYKKLSESSNKIHTDSDIYLFKHIDNVTIKLPKEKKYYPGEDYLSYFD